MTARESKKFRMRRWRERHPLLAAWHAHRWNAKQRGIPVIWTMEEFAAFCEETGYHLIRCDGWTIDRIDARLGYFIGNCQLLTLSENSAKGAREKFSRLFSSAP